MAALEYLCNGEMDRLEDQGNIEGEPWFIADASEIHRSMLGMYSEKTIYSALKAISDAGLLTIEQRGLGKRNRYFFNSDRTQEAIRKRYVFDGNFTVEDWCSDTPSDGRSDGNFTVDPTIPPLYINEYEHEVGIRQETQSLSDSNQTPTITEDLATFTEDTEHADDLTELTVDNISEWVQDLFHERTSRKQSGLMGKSKARLTAMFSDLGEFSFRKKLDEFLDGGGTVIEDFVSGKPVASRNQLRRAPEAGRGVFERRVAGVHGYHGQSTQQRSFPAQDSHTPASQELVERWNAAVPDWRKVELEGKIKGYAVSMVQQMTLDSEFLDSYDKILQKSAAIFKNKGAESSWLSFGWLFVIKENTGPNWGKLVRGDFDSMAVGDKPERKRFKTQGELNAESTRELARRIRSGEYKPNEYGKDGR